jgi:hypothetical protein
MQLFQNKKQNQNEWYLSNQKENKKYTENVFWNKPNRSLIFIFYLCFMLEGELWQNNNSCNLQLCDEELIGTSSKCIRGKAVNIQEIHNRSNPSMNSIMAEVL